MKKNLLLVVISVMTMNFAFSQAPITKGDKQVNFGFGNNGAAGFRSNGIYVGMDYCIMDDLTIGGKLGINHWGGDGYSLTILSPTIIADYHFNTLIGIPSQFDFYAGADLGMPFYFGVGSGTGDFDLGTHVGGRWYWNEKWGVNLELGLGILSGGNGAQLGVSMKL